MSGWPTVALDEICEINVGRTPSRARREYWEGATPWLSIADMNQGRDLYVTKERVTDLAVAEAVGPVVRQGTVLLSFKLSIGKVGIAKAPMYTNEAIAALPIREPDRMLPEFLYWAIKSIDFANGANRAAMGATLNKAKLRVTRIPMPPIEEQRRIAEVLDRVDELRAKRRQALAHLEVLAEAIFFEMFSEKVPTTLLGEHLSFVTSGGRGWARYYVEQGVRFIRSLDVRMNDIDGSGAAYVDPPDNAEARRTKTRAYDVLLTITGSRIGRVATLPAELSGAYVSQHVAILRLVPDSLRPRFVSFFLNLTSGGQRQILAAQYGQTKPGLNFEQIRKFEIPTPELRLQDEFCERLAAVSKLKEAHQAHLVELDGLFGSLQDRAFRGAL